MTDVLRWLLVPCFILGGWFLSRHYADPTRRFSRALPIVLALLLLSLAGTGWLRLTYPAAEIHKWSGHATVIVAWLSTPFSIGVLFQRGFANRPIATWGASFVVFAGLGLTMLTAFTGYMGPSHGPYDGPRDAENLRRFQVLHMFMLPAVLAALLALWFWILRPRCADPTASVESQRHDLVR